MKQILCDKCHKILVKHLYFKLDQTNPWVNVSNRKFHLCANCYDRFCNFLNDDTITKDDKRLAENNDPFIATFCPSCGNCMWKCEDNKMVCAVCGYIAERNKKE